MEIVKTTVDIIFGFGLFINAIIYLPQVIKIIRLKEAKDLSFVTFFGICLLQLVMGLHGYFHQDYVLMVGMWASLIVSAFLTYLIVLYGNKKHG